MRNLLIALSLAAGTLLAACSSPSQTSSYPGVVLLASPSENAVALSNSGARISYASGPYTSDVNGALVTSGGASFLPTTITYVDGGTSLASGSFYLCDATSGITSLNLPLADAGSGRLYRVVKTDTSANGCLLKVTGSDKVWGTAIRNATQVGLPDAGSTATVASDGAGVWWILSAQ